MSAARHGHYPFSWGHADLEKLIADNRAGLSLRECAARQGGGVTARECDLALWAKLGRTIPEACDVLNARLA